MQQSLGNLIMELKRIRYGSIRRFPLRKDGRHSLPLWKNEIMVFGRYVLNKSNLFSISRHPEWYRYPVKKSGSSLLFHCFFLNQAYPLSVWEQIFPEEWVIDWIDKGLLIENPNQTFYFVYRIVPFGGYYLITSRFDRSIPDFTYLSYDSLFFFNFISERLSSLSFSGSGGLDICCGVGIQSFAAARFCQQVLGLDLNGHSIRLAQMNALLNHIGRVAFCNGDLFQLPEGKYDLIVANPPFIYSIGSETEMLDSSGGEPFGLGLTFDVLKQSISRINEKGKIFVLTRAPLFKGGDYLLKSLSPFQAPGLNCIYYDLGDSIVPLDPKEEKIGLQGYKHVILELYPGEGTLKIQSSWFRKRAFF